MLLFLLLFLFTLLLGLSQLTSLSLLELIVLTFRSSGPLVRHLLFLFSRLSSLVIVRRWGAFFEECVYGLNRHADRPDNVKHVEKCDEGSYIWVLWQVVEYHILDKVTVSQVRKSTHNNAHCSNYQVCDYRLAEHRTRLVLLWIYIQDADVTFEDCHDFTHEKWQDIGVKVFIVEGCGQLFLSSLNNFARRVWVCHVHFLALCTLVNRVNFDCPDANDWSYAA